MNALDHSVKRYLNLWVLVCMLSVGIPSNAVAVDFEIPISKELSGSDPKDVVVGDFNGDNFQDLAVTMYSGGAGQVSLRFNNGLGGFEENGNIPLTFGSWGIAPGLFNEDALQDLAITNGVSVSTDVKIYTSNGDRTFTEGATLNAGNFPIAIAVEDYNGDNLSDLAVANNNDNQNIASVFLSTGQGTFSAALQISVNPAFQSHDIFPARLNDDNHFDLVVAHNAGVRVFLGDGTGQFSEGVNVGDSQVFSVSARDLNGDNSTDIVGVLANGALIVSMGNGNGTFQTPQTYPAVSTNNSVDLVLTDLDLNGTLDAAVTDGALDRVAVLLGNGNGSFQTPLFFDVGNEPITIAAGLINSDVYPDLVVPNRNAGDTPSVSILIQKVPADTDGDGLPDSIENGGCTDVNDADSDDDGISDGIEDSNHNGVVDADETKPCEADSDNDGIQDGTELGYIPAGPGTNTGIFIPDLDPASTTDPTNADTDGDGIPDGVEDANHNGRVDPGESDPTVAVGDVNDDGKVDLKDAISALQVLVAMVPAPGVSTAASTDANRVIGLDEAVYVLQRVAQMRP